MHFFFFDASGKPKPGGEPVGEPGGDPVGEPGGEPKGW